MSREPWQTYRWREISSAPEEAGVYAWYYSPEITAFDLERIIAEVENLKASDGQAAAAEAVRKFLQECVFQYFQEEPYQTVLRGPLKPRYEGLLEHKPGLSETLVERLVDEPRRLNTIKRVLEDSAPYSASPIYIGMSEKLRVRLSRHKALIEKYDNTLLKGLDYQTEGTLLEGEKRDHSFAREIRTRNITPTRLFVVVYVINDMDGEYVDIENILNRIHYPLLGRN